MADQTTIQNYQSVWNGHQIDSAIGNIRGVLDSSRNWQPSVIEIKDTDWDDAPESESALGKYFCTGTFSIPGDLNLTTPPVIVLEYSVNQKNYQAQLPATFTSQKNESSSDPQEKKIISFTCYSNKKIAGNILVLIGQGVMLDPYSSAVEYVLDCGTSTGKTEEQNQPVEPTV